MDAAGGSREGHAAPGCVGGIACASAYGPTIGVMSAGDAKHPMSYDFAKLTDDEFDELVYLLAATTDTRVAKMKAPDGGLDTVRPSDGDSCVALWGVQAKLHRQHIKWASCKESLDRAVTIWQPQRMTFAFPRDLTANQHMLFHKHLGRRHEGVEVDWWGASRLTGLLLDSRCGRGILKRFFHLEDPADLSDRAIRAGGPLRTAQDVLERTDAISEFLESADPHFEWIAAQRPKSSTPLPPTPGQVLRLGISDGEREKVYDAVPRGVSSLDQLHLHGAIEYEDAQEAERARALLQAVMSNGGRANLGQARIRVEGIPAPFESLFDPGTPSIISVRMTKDPVPWPSTVLVSSDLGRAALDLDLMPVEPEDEWDAKLVGERHGFVVELRFVWSHSERVGSVNVTWRLGRASGTSAECAQVLRLMLALHGAGNFEIRGRDDPSRTMRESMKPSSVPAGLKALQGVFEDLATIEAFAGVILGPPPDMISGEDAHHLAWLASAIREGGYEVQVQTVTLTCTAVGPLDQLQPGAHNVRLEETLVTRFFGRERAIARRVVNLPEMVVQKVSRMSGVEPRWRVELVSGTGRDVSVRFALLPLYADEERAAA